MNRFFICNIIIFTLAELTGLFFNRLFSPVAATAMVRGIQTILFLALCHQMKLTEYFFGKSPCQNCKKGILISFFIGLFFLIAVLTSKYILSLHILKMMLFKYPDNFTLLLITGGIISPFAEEFFFRGIIYNIFKKRINIHLAVLLTSLIFAAFHLSHVKIPMIQFAGGVLFTYVYAYSKSLIPAMIVHCTGNIAIFSIPLIYKIVFLRNILF